MFVVIFCFRIEMKTIQSGSCTRKYSGVKFNMSVMLIVYRCLTFLDPYIELIHCCFFFKLSSVHLCI